MLLQMAKFYFYYSIVNSIHTTVEQYLIINIYYIYKHIYVYVHI